MCVCVCVAPVPDLLRYDWLALLRCDCLVLVASIRAEKHEEESDKVHVGRRSWWINGSNPGRSWVCVLCETIN